MSNISLIVLSSGMSKRFNCKVKKHWIRVGDEPLWLFITKKIANIYSFKNVVITANKKEIEYMKNYSKYTFVCGGKTRQESLKLALKKINSKYVMATDVARVNVDKKLIKRLIKNKKRAHNISPYISIVDTVKYDNKNIDRDKIKLIQTPQVSRTKTLKQVLKSTKEFTDESSALYENNKEVKYIKGYNKLGKITFASDLKLISHLLPTSKENFIGMGFDVHKKTKGKYLILGGVKIDSSSSLKGHSDADVVIHSLVDAILGAISNKDIGELYPDSSSKFKNIDSMLILKEVVDFTNSVGYIISNVDITVIAQTPKLFNYKENMRRSIAKVLKIKIHRVSIKATTTEKLGYIGKDKAIASYAIASLRFYNWEKHTH